MMEKKHEVLYIVMMDVDPDYEEEFNKWYNEEHLPGLLKVPGALSGSRYKLLPEQEVCEKKGNGGVPKYLAIYEHQSIEVQNTETYQKVRSTPWTKQIIPHCKVRVRNFYVQIFPQEGYVPD